MPPQPGDEVEVLLEAVEDETGAIVLSYRKAKRQKAWEEVIAKHKEGDVVTGMVTRKIKGGLLVNIGVNVFLPASQVDIRRPPDIADYIGQDDRVHDPQDRRGPPQHRRQPPQAASRTSASELKKKLLAEIEPGQVRKGVVKNIADFGAFVDLGGIDGLLHITDMSWGRINQPAATMVQIDQELEVIVLHVDKEKEKIALGLKQKTRQPVGRTSPTSTRSAAAHTGEVVNVMSYGAFVKLEAGIEGLVHISEMSWTKRINHPSELVHDRRQDRGRQVLNINKEKQEISLGMKQAQPNPWDKVAETLPARHGRHGHRPQPDQLRRLHRDRGGHRRPAARHRHELGPQDRPPQRGRQKGDKVTCVVLNVDQERKRDRPGPEADGQRPVGGRHPRPLPARRRSRRARSPSSPTSASSSSWSRAWKACCTSPSWPTTRSRAPRTSSRSATRSR